MTVGGPCYTRAMEPDLDPFPTPTVAARYAHESRGDPPGHHDRVPGRNLPYTLDEARMAARDRLNLWLAQHPGVTPGGHGQHRV